MTPLRSKALTVLRSGRLTVIRTASTADNTVAEFTAKVQSSREGGATYAVDLAFGRWSCTCGSHDICAHIAAAQLVTGHAPAALLATA